MGALLRRIARTCILLMAAVILAIGLAGSWCAFAQSPKAALAAEKPAASGTPAAENLTRAAEAANPAINTKDIVNRLNGIVNAALKDPAISGKMLPQGIVPRPMDVAEFKAFVDSERTKFGKVVEAANIRLSN